MSKIFATAVVNTPPSTADSGTTLTVNAGQGTRLDLGYATIHPEGVLPTHDTAEVVKITNIADDTLTIVRSQKGTTAKNTNKGWRITNAIYVEDTGWVSVPYLPGYEQHGANTPLQYRRIGNVYYFRGTVKPTSGDFTTSYQQVAGPWPAEVAHAWDSVGLAPSGAGSPPLRMYIHQTTYELNIATTGGTAPYCALRIPPIIVD